MPRALHAQDVQTFLFELAAEPRFAIGDVNAFDDVAARCAEPAPEFHFLFRTTHLHESRTRPPVRIEGSGRTAGGMAANLTNYLD
jgi:hypothetical protein